MLTEQDGIDILAELEALDKSELKRLNLNGLTRLIDAATLEMKWMKSALTEIANLAAPLMQPEDKSPICVLRRLIKEREAK